MVQEYLSYCIDIQAFLIKLKLCLILRLREKHFCKKGIAIGTSMEKLNIWELLEQALVSKINMVTDYE